PGRRRRPPRRGPARARCASASVGASDPRQGNRIDEANTGRHRGSRLGGQGVEGEGLQDLMSLAGLQQMKREGRKIVAVVAWDYQIAQIADRAGVDLVSVGDSVGVNLWGRQQGEISLDEMLI